MKRYAVFAILLFVVAGAVANVTRFSINSSEMKDGETKTFTEDGRKVTVRRDGDVTHVTVEDPRILDDVPRHGLIPRKAQTFFVCPKDHTMLRVPDEKSGETFKCPVDGSTMEKRKGRGFAFFFDDDAFDYNDL